MGESCRGQARRGRGRRPRPPLPGCGTRDAVSPRSPQRTLTQHSLCRRASGPSPAWLLCWGRGLSPPVWAGSAAPAGALQDEKADAA